MNYPFADLESLAHAWFPHLTADEDVARLLGIPRGSLHACRARGYVHTIEADKMATSLGLHPSLVWPSWFDDALLERFCEACGDPLPLDSPLAMFCHEQGCQRAKRRRQMRRYRRRVREEAVA